MRCNMMPFSRAASHSSIGSTTGHPNMLNTKNHNFYILKIPKASESPTKPSTHNPAKYKSLKLQIPCHFNAHTNDLSMVLDFVLQNISRGLVLLGGWCGFTQVL